jgi:hypothetical protein
MGIDWGTLTEAKLTKGIHAQFSSDFHVVTMEATSSSQGGLFQVEAVK